MNEFVNQFCGDIRSEYTINDPRVSENVKSGLRNSDGTGVLAGITRIGSVQGYYMEDGVRLPMKGKLYYRGINVEDIVEQHMENDSYGFEEVAYLLLFGKLPDQEQFDLFCEMLSKARTFPNNFTEDVILKSPSKNIMNKLARGVMALYSYDEAPEDDSVENLIRQSIELIGRFPIIVANAYQAKRHYFDGKSLYLHNPKENISISENLLRMLRKDKSYTPEEAKILDLLLMVCAEHGGGDPTAFTCRAISSAGADTYSAIAGAIGSLKGEKQGGIMVKVVEMLEDIKANVPNIKNDEMVSEYLDKVLRGEAFDGSGRIYGIGHTVYTLTDPRSELLKKYAREMAEKKGMQDDFRIMEKVEVLGIPRIMAYNKSLVPLCATVDMYAGLICKMLEIPSELYAPLFSVSRIAGWCAHRIEEVVSGNKIMRPAYRAAVAKIPYTPMEDR